MTTLSAPQASEESAPSRHPLAPLFNAGTGRARSARVLRSVEQDLSASFKLDAEALTSLARRVAAHLTATDFNAAAQAPAQDAPLWAHLQAGGIDRMAELDGLLADQPPEERARAWLDLAVLGVLLGADPGPRWRCSDQSTLPTAAFAQGTPDELLAMLDRAGRTAGGAAVLSPVARAVDASEAPAAVSAPAVSAPPPPPLSPPALAATTYGGGEGLAVAAFRAFVAGAFSADKTQPCRVDAGTLRHIDVAAVRAMLQGTPQNPVQGLEGRATVLSRLGQVLQALPGAGGALARPCDLVRSVTAASVQGTPLQAASLLSELLRALAPVWPAAPVQGLPGGDIWQHRWAGEVVADDSGAAEPPAHTALSDLGTGGWVPLHAMGQALVLALALPLHRAGQTLVGLQHLSAIADQPTSALLLAAGVVVPRHPRLLSRSLKLGDEAVIECRALTVALFDELTRQVQALLQAREGPGATAPTVAQVVQATAAMMAGGGAPALRIEGDGALF